MNRTLNLCKAFGWQGGTIHQVEKETGCKAYDLLYAEPSSTHLNTDYTMGWFAVGTCSLGHNKGVVFPKYKGNIDFWLGVADRVAIGDLSSSEHDAKVASANAEGLDKLNETLERLTKP